MFCGYFCCCYSFLFSGCASCEKHIIFNRATQFNGISESQVNPGWWGKHIFGILFVTLSEEKIKLCQFVHQLNIWPRSITNSLHIKILTRTQLPSWNDVPEGPRVRNIQWTTLHFAHVSCYTFLYITDTILSLIMNTLLVILF